MPDVSPASPRYLSAADVAAAMPPLADRLALARLTLEALVGHAQLPPKIGVHPAPETSFGHAMPAWLDGAARGRVGDTGADLLGMKWVVGFPGNVAPKPAISGTVLLSDAADGHLRGILDAGPITAQRTAAISGVAIERWAPAVRGRRARVALVGAGVQGASHLAVVGHLLRGSDLALHDRDGARAEALAAEAEASGAFGSVRVVGSAIGAIEGADVVVTLVSFGPHHQALPVGAFADGALVVAVDYDMCVPAALAARAPLFLVDERGQYLANRDAGIFAGYRDPDASLGEALLQGTRRPDGTVLVTHLGVGLADVVFGDAVLRAAEARGLGTLLPR